MAFEAIAVRRFRFWEGARFEGYDVELFPFCGLLLLALVPVAPPAGLAAAAAIWLASGFNCSVPGSFRTRKPALSGETVSMLESLYHVPVGEPLAQGERTYRSRLTLNLGTSLLPLALLTLLVASRPSLAPAALALLLPIALLTCLLGANRPGVGITLPPFAGLAALPLAVLVGADGMLLAAAAGAGVMVGSLALTFSVGREGLGAPTYRIGGKGSGGAVLLAAILGQLV